MTLRLGYVTQTTMEYEDAIPAAAAMDLDYVELLMDGHHARHRIAGETDAIASLAGEVGVDLLVHLPFKLDIGSPLAGVREGARQELAATLETAAAFDAEKAVVHAASDAWRPAWSREDVQPRILDSIRHLDDVAADHGIELCVENIPDEWFGLAAFDRLFAETDASITFDTGHAAIEGYDAADQRAFLDEHADRVSHVHLNDTRGSEDEHVPLGAGRLDFGSILGPLETATLSVEVFTYGYDYVGLSAQHVRREVDGLGE